MISIKYVASRIKDVKISDYLSLIPMLVAKIISPLFKRKYNDYWLVCEEPAEARDNGYVFFKYLVQNTSQKCIYAIKKKSVDYDKVKDIGETVEYGSIKHWIIYFTSRYNISSQKGGKPNAALCSFFELNNIFKPTNIFLQHGIIINNVKWLYRDKSKIDIFITSTRKETDFIKKNFGYPKGTVRMTGMPRFDEYIDINVNNKMVVIMPTWRYWFNLRSKQSDGINRNFEDSDYYQAWSQLLTSKELNALIEKENLNVVFYLHRNLQRYARYFDVLDTKVKIARWQEYDIRELLKKSAALITDYSSVFFDMVYMKKAVIFYQFDVEEYRKVQYEKGYFDYDNNPFAKTYKNYQEVVRELSNQSKNHFSPSKKYMEEYRKTFTYQDSNCCKRIYEILKGLNNDTVAKRN